MLGKILVTNMTRRETNTALCPDAQTLAAFVDNTLPMEKRGEVKTHLVDCDRCLAIVAETLKTGEDLSQTANPHTRHYVKLVVPMALAAGLALFMVYSHLQKTEQQVRIATIPPPQVTDRSREKTEPAASQATQLPLSDTLKQPATTTSTFCVAVVERLLASTPAARNIPLPTTEHEYGFTSQVNPERQWFRMGRLLVQLELSRRAQDRNRLGSIISEMRKLASTMETPEVSDLLSRSEPAGRMAKSLDAIGKKKGNQFPLEFGSWTEAGLLASREGNPRFTSKSEIEKFKVEAVKRALPQGIINNLSEIERISVQDHVTAEDTQKQARLFETIQDLM
ncbi:MAG: hypothetical protein WC156_05215 [Pedobacter sp.]